MNTAAGTIETTTEQNYREALSHLIDHCLVNEHIPEVELRDGTLVKLTDLSNFVRHGTIRKQTPVLSMQPPRRGPLTLPKEQELNNMVNTGLAERQNKKPSQSHPPTLVHSTRPQNFL